MQHNFSSPRSSQPQLGIPASQWQQDQRPAPAVRSPSTRTSPRGWSPSRRPAWRTSPWRSSPSARPSRRRCSPRTSWFASGSISSLAAHRRTSQTPWATRLKRWPPLHPTRSPATCSCLRRMSPPPTATTASTAHFAGLGSPTFGCWTSCPKGHQIGGGSISAAATSARRERTTTCIGAHTTLHCPALHRQPGTAVSIDRADYEHHQRQAVANLDADYHQQPKSWVIAIDDSNTNQKRLRVEALWSGSKMRWVRHHVVTKAGNPGCSSAICLAASTQRTLRGLCLSVPSFRLMVRTFWQMLYQVSMSSWLEPLGLRARILRMVDQFTADILATAEVQRARMMAAYRQWDEKSAIDPNWDQHSFFERAYTDNRLMDWAHQITTHIDQRYICRKGRWAARRSSTTGTGSARFY